MSEYDTSVMASARKATYAPKRENDTFEELSGKLTADLRNHVRFMVRVCSAVLALELDAWSFHN